jgi:adenine phosphoribosyltransferase
VSDLREELQRAIPIIDGDADIWALFRDPDLYRRVLAELAIPFEGKVDVVVGVEARGFIVSQALALHMDLPFIGVRKDTGFFPGECWSKQGEPDYRGNRHTLRIQRAGLEEGQTCLMADDWIETGNQAMCLKSLAEEMGAHFYGVASIVDQVNPERKKELGVFHGLITNAELFQGQEQHDYQKESRETP